MINKFQVFIICFDFPCISCHHSNQQTPNHAALQHSMLTLVNVTELNFSVFPGQLTICKFLGDADAGITSSYVGSTSANKVGFVSFILFVTIMNVMWKTRSSKVFVRHAKPVQQDQIQYLNIDQKITALCNHPLHHAAVVLGTTSHLLIYDIAENRTIMSKEVNLLVDIFYIFLTFKKVLFLPRLD